MNTKIMQQTGIDGVRREFYLNQEVYALNHNGLINHGRLIFAEEQRCDGELKEFFHLRSDNHTRTIIEASRVFNTEQALHQFMANQAMSPTSEASLYDALDLIRTLETNTKYAEHPGLAYFKKTLTKKSND